MTTVIKRTAKKAAAVVLAVAMALSVGPVVNADAKAKVKAPTLNYKGPKAINVEIELGKQATLIVKKGTYKIKSIKFSSSDKSVATVSKKGKTGIVTAKKLGTAKIKAVVTTKKTKKKTKKYTLSTKVTVVEPDLDIPEDTWITAKDPNVTDLVKEMFTQINADTEGASYVPTAILGYRISSADASTTWRVLARKTIVTPDAPTTYAITEFVETATGTITLSKVYDSEITALATATEALEGGWSEASDPMIEDDYYLPLYNALNPEGKDGFVRFPVAGVGSQVVAGVNILLVVEATAVTPEANPSYQFVYAFIGLDGTITVDEEKTVTVSTEA
ncbi:MAG: Ig-like domain-containing protein [Eubacterium sp.]|nr:Ig-like domain-containing protein [Eubacterium sp.]